MFHPKTEFMMVHLKIHRFAPALALVLILGATFAGQGWIAARPSRPACAGGWLQDSGSQPASRYEFRVIHDPNGTGKFYMGREIAQVMGAGGMYWLDRPERAQEEHPEVVIQAMDLHSGDVVVDFGAGSGYFTFRIAPKVGNSGKVLAVDIQEEMLDAIRSRATSLGITNVEEVKDTETDPRLPPDSVDRVLMVDVYHELAYPYEVMTKVREALKPDGRVVFVEYRKEDASVPIKEVHKMSVEQLTREMDVVGLVRVQDVESLPWQHILIYARRDDAKPIS